MCCQAGILEDIELMKAGIIRNIALSLILIITIAVLTGCGKATLPDIEAPEDTSNDINTTLSDWSVQLTGSTPQTLYSIADVVEAIKPSVVTIDTEVTYNIFRRSFTQEGAGSGWIIGENGIIVTNNHVVEGAQTITVTLDDGRVFTADPETVSADPQSDLAVLRIDAQDLPVAKIGDSTKLRVGDWLVVIGNPLGLGISAKEGIVSRLGVSLNTGGLAQNDLIETSAAINAGNSGGPLVNMNGEVIGITSSKIASVGVEGLGYAISLNEAIPILYRLIHGD